MITIRRAEKRGRANFGWLDTHYTFSFNTYYDPKHMGFRNLRVINEDFVAAGKGFPKHGHRDMEIITYVLSGALAHKDSTGGEGVLDSSEVQRMTAGTGIEHSEFNPSEKEKLHLYQIWILPNAEGLTPGYEQKSFPRENKRGMLCLVASPEARGNSLKINQDVSLYASVLNSKGSVEHELGENRHAWIQVAKGSLDLNGSKLSKSDGAAVSDESLLKLVALEDETEFLLFDLN